MLWIVEQIVERGEKRSGRGGVGVGLIWESLPHLWKLRIIEQIGGGASWLWETPPHPRVSDLNQFLPTFQT